MRGGVLVGATLLLLAAGGARAGEPAVYERCRKCHGAPGEWWAKSFGPDLTKSTYTFEQFYNQVTYGSRWEGKPPKKFAYKTREMPAQVGLSDDEIRALYDWLKGRRE